MESCLKQREELQRDKNELIFEIEKPFKETSRKMKSSSSNVVLGLRRSVDLNMNSNLQKDEERKSSESSKSRRKTSKTETTGDLKHGSEKPESSLTFTSEDDIYYEPGGISFILLEIHVLCLKSVRKIKLLLSNIANGS